MLCVVAMVICYSFSGHVCGMTVVYQCSHRAQQVKDSHPDSHRSSGWWGGVICKLIIVEGSTGSVINNYY